MLTQFREKSFKKSLDKPFPLCYNTTVRKKGRRLPVIPMEERKMSKVASKLRNWFGFDVVEDEEIEEIELEEEQELQPIAAREEKRRERRNQGKIVDLPISGNRSKLIVYRPVSYEDTMSIIDNLKSVKDLQEISEIM